MFPSAMLGRADCSMACTGHLTSNVFTQSGALSGISLSGVEEQYVVGVIEAKILFMR